MSNLSTTTGSSTPVLTLNIDCSKGDHFFFSSQTYRGHLIALSDSSGIQMCPAEEHDLAVIHHTDDRGHHWCPTGFVMCQKCTAIGDEPEPYECNGWDEAAQ